MGALVSRQTDVYGREEGCWRMRDIETQYRRMEQILKISRELSSTVSLEPLLHKIVEAAVELTESERRRICLWLDGNAAFYGVYLKSAQLAQRRGQRIPPPKLQ